MLTVKLFTLIISPEDNRKTKSLLKGGGMDPVRFKRVYVYQ